MRQEIARDRDQVRPALARPECGLPRSADSGRRNAEVEVREVDDPEAVQLRRQPGQLELEYTST
jgi:hypothetical protein